MILEPETIKEKKEEVYYPETTKEKEPEPRKEEIMYDVELNNPKIINRFTLPSGTIGRFGPGIIVGANLLDNPAQPYFTLMESVGPESTEQGSVKQAITGDSMKNSQIELQHQEFGDKVSFLFAFRAPVFLGKGSITNGGNTLISETKFNWTGDELKAISAVSCYVNITDQSGKLESRKIISNTADTLTLSQNWTLATGTYNYMIWKPVYLGAADWPFQRLYIMNDIRFGKGASAGADVIYIKHGEGSPEGAVTANIGSLYMRTNGAAGTTLYVKESGTGNTGWTAIRSFGGEVSSHLIPSADNTYDLGSTSKKWKDLYAKGCVIDGGGYILNLTVGAGVGSNVNPLTDQTYNIGTAEKRWLSGRFVNLYCTNQTTNKFITGDLEFKHKGEIVFRIDENPDFLNFYNKDKNLIMRLGKDGTIFTKTGKIEKL